MTHTIDLHDTISIIIPGTCVLCVTALFHYNDVSEMLPLLKEFSIGSSILFLACSYIVGEVFQTLGYFLVKIVYEKFHLFGGDPMFLLLRSEDKQSGLLPASSCRQVLDYLEKDLKFRPAKEKELGACFYHIKTKVYAHDAYRTECIKMLSKANFFSTMSVVTLLLPVLFYFVAPSAQTNDCVVYCFVHDTYHITSNSSFCGINMLMCILAYFLMVYLCIKRYHFFNTIYNRCLLTAYLAVRKNSSDESSEESR